MLIFAQNCLKSVTPCPKAHVVQILEWCSPFLHKHIYPIHCLIYNSWFKNKPIHNIQCCQPPPGILWDSTALPPHRQAPPLLSHFFHSRCNLDLRAIFICFNKNLISIKTFILTEGTQPALCLKISSHILRQPSEAVQNATKERNTLQQTHTYLPASNVNQDGSRP